MPLIVRQYNYVAGALIIASQNNTNETTIYDLLNGQLDEDNFSSLAESVITFNPTTGHDHDGTDSRKINFTDAGPNITAQTSGTDHSIKGISSSGSSHAGIYGQGTTATAYGGLFTHAGASGTALLVEAPVGGNPATIQNASGAAGDSALKVAHRSTTASKAAIEVTQVTSSGYGLYINNVAGRAVQINHNVSTSSAVDITQTGSTAALSLDNTNSSGIALFAEANNQAVTLRNNVNAATAQIMDVGVGVAGVTAASGGWIRFDGQLVTNSTTIPVLNVLGKSSTNGTLVALNQDNGQSAGTTAAVAWVLKVEGTGGNDDNCAYFDGRVYADGNLHVAGTLSKAAGSFEIDHPLKPEKARLRHSFVESPDMKNIYDGRAQLDQVGRAEVVLPKYFSALNRDLRVQLTGMGPGDLWVEDLTEESFVIQGTPSQVVFWQVTGIRKDRYAMKYPVVVEEDKPEPGYIHPELWQ